MKHLLVLFIFTFSGFCLFSETINELEKINQYGGVTIERLNNEDESLTKGWTRMVEYFNDSRQIIARVLSLTQSVSKEKGIIEQIIYYDGNNNVEAYEMLFSDEHTNIHDYDKVVEFIGGNNMVIRTMWFKNNQIIDRIDYPDDPNRFQFYNIEFLNNEFQNVIKEISPQPPSRGEFFFSQKYISIRSVIKFDTEIFDLNDTDLLIIKTNASRFNALDMIKLYSKKVRVYHNNSYWWLFLQTNLIEHVKGQNATIMYYPIMFNGILYLDCVGFLDL